jgi:6-pyruvoyl-tetrahydropterin synthase
VIDIGLASNLLAEVLAEFNFKHLNELFPNDNTTTEFMCKTIHSAMCDKLIKNNFKGGLKVKLFESHKAWASYSKSI